MVNHIPMIMISDAPCLHPSCKASGKAGRKLKVPVWQAHWWLLNGWGRKCKRVYKGMGECIRSAVQVREGDRWAQNILFGLGRLHRSVAWVGEGMQECTGGWLRCDEDWGGCIGVCEWPVQCKHRRTWEGAWVGKMCTSDLRPSLLSGGHWQGRLEMAITWLATNHKRKWIAKHSDSMEGRGSGMVKTPSYNYRWFRTIETEQ